MSVMNALESGRSVRYHANPDMSRHLQNNAEHQWGVLAIILMLHPSPSLDLIMEAQFHDGGELWVGDLPAPFKRMNPEFAAQHHEMELQICDEKGIPRFALDDVEKAWLWFADRMESFLYMRRKGQHWPQADRTALYYSAVGLEINDTQILELLR